MESVEDVRIEGLRKSFGDLDVLHGVTFTLSAGGVYCLMAPSGSGKTTLFKVLLGLDAADAGVETGIAPGQIAAMFQEERLCEALTPVENVLLVCPRGTRRARVRSLLSRILPEDSPRPAQSRSLSGGHAATRVASPARWRIPRGCCRSDEPFHRPRRDATEGRVIEFLLSERRGRTMLVSTHAEGDVALLGGEKIELDRVQG
ncbi:MAG: ATP-binding cassette domain-containing protein [Collinsella sp.]